MAVLGARLAFIATTVVLLASCGGSGAGPTRSSSRPKPPASASSDADAPCIAARIHRGAPPAWTAAAWSESSPGFRIPYALASNDAAGAFFFLKALRAGHPSNPANKVLWIVRFPRNGNPLTITARLGTDPSEVVHTSWPANSSPGEIYPSIIDLPKAGCWRLSLAWGPHRARIDIEVERPA
jgi:hypothetical protein